MLICQSLIWCAHDVQMLFARLYRYVSFGDLAVTGVTPTPERVLNQMRNKRVVLDAALDAFFATDEWRRHEVEPPVSSIRFDLRDHSDTRVRRMTKWPAWRFEGREPGWMTGGLVAMLMKQIAALLRDEDNAMLARTAEAPTRNGEAKSFVREWYGVASPLAAGAVALRRLIQAEGEMEHMIDQRVRLVDGGLLLREGLALPAYPKVLPYRTENRLDTLLNFYRDTLFDDPEPDESDKKKTEQRRVPKAAKESYEFLRDRGERLIHHHHGVADDPQRSFYLLDVIPEHRFCVG